MPARDDVQMPQAEPSRLESEVVSAGADLMPRTGLDHPTGRFVSIPSAISNRPVCYFIPDPLHDLLMRCAESITPQEPEDSEEIHAAALLSLVARRGFAGVVDPDHAEALFDLLWQAPSIRTEADLRAVGDQTGRHMRQFRQQIVFTGGRVASEAVHVYAPHEAVPSLMAQLVEGIGLSAVRVSAVDRVAIMGFFCLHAHPFRDGNGRWTRALILSVERRSLLRTMAATSFQTFCMRALAESVWPRTRSYGLRDYLAACNRYTEMLLTGYRNGMAFETVQGVNEALRRASKDKSKLRALARCLFVTGQLQAAEVKQLLGASNRVVNGLFQSLQDCGLSASQQGVSTEVLLNEVERQARVAAAHSLDNLEGSSQ